MTKKKDTTQKILKEEEKIRKIAKYILIAFCMQFMAYLLLINVVPLGHDDNGDGIINSVYDEENRKIRCDELNSLYYEKWDGNGSWIVKDKVVYADNGMRFIYGFNMVLLVATLLLSGYYILVFMDKNERKCMAKNETLFQRK